nr:MAG: MuF-C-terminal domain [Bacteriophage sp.]
MSLISKKKFMNGIEKNQSKAAGSSGGLMNRTDFVAGVQNGNEEMRRRQAAFEAYRAAVQLYSRDGESGQKKAESAGAAISGKVSQQEYSRSSAMQTQYGSYQNYLRGVEAAQGRQLGLMALQQQSAALTFRPSVKSQKDDVNKAIARARAMKTVERDQVRGMRRTSKLLEGEIYNREVEQADTHFSGTGLSENGKSVTQLQNEIDALQKRKAQVDSQSVLARAQEAIGDLSEEDQNLLRQYRGKELNGYQVRAYAKYDAKKALNEKGYDDEKLKQLAEWQKVLDDYENAQKLDAAAQEIGQRSPVGGTLFSAALAPGKALGNLESLRGVLPSWAGGYQNEDMPMNVYSPAYNATRLSSGIRGSVMQNMDPGWQFLYQAGTSALDSAVNMAVSTGLVGTFGGVAGAGAKDAVAETMNWVMGSQVAADSVYEGIQNGKSNQEALIDGIVEGAIEGITEKYSVGDIIENMLSGKAVWKKALRSFASEGAEEIASNWLNRAYDVVAKHDRGEVMSAYAAYIADGKTPAQALAAMVGDFAKEDSLSFLAGGLSGLAMSGTYAGVNRVILEANVTQTARAVIEAGEVQDVIDYGMAQEEGTRAHQLAEELQQTVDEGGEVTQKAVEDTLREVAKEQQAAVDEGQEPRVPETLTRLEQLQAQEQQTQAKAEADEKTFQIYKSAAETAQENQRIAEQYRQEQEQNRAQQSVQAVQQAQQAAQQQYNQDSLFAPIPGTESMGELDPVQYARKQTAGAEQELDEAAAQQEEQYLQEQARRAGYDEITASYFLNGNTTGMPAEQYAQSFGQVYEQGRLGASEQRAMRYAEGMNQDVAAAAYRAGLAAGQKGVNNGSIEITDEGQIGQAGQRAEGQAGGVRQSTAQRQRADTGRKRAEGARDLAKAWDEVTLSELGFGENNAQKVRVMPKGQEGRSEDIQAAEKFFRSMGVQNARFFTGQLAQEIDGETFYADAAVTEDGSVLIRADSEEYSAFELAKHEGYHLLVKRWPEMAAKIQKRLLGEGKITKEMIESYVGAYAGIYGDDTDAYVEEIIADTYAGMNRTDYGTNKLRADVKMEVGQWQKKSGSARAPPAKMSIAQDFKSRVAAWYKSGMPEGTSFVLGETGATLQGLGAIESDIYMNGEKISTILKEHPEMTIREIQRIPEILDDPVLILKSRNSANVRENSRLVIFGTVKASDGRAVMCVMDLRPTENGLLLDDMQKVASAYTKDKHPDRFVQNSFVLHADEKRTIPLLRTIGFQMPITLQRYGSMGSITYKGPKVNLYGEKFSDVVSVGTTAETAKRKFSASADQTAAEQRKQNDKTALDYFGRTYKWSETGYVLLNGARLDFSGRHEGGPGGYRTVDHRDIIDALGEDYGGGDYSGGMVRFMQEGNIRISPESGGINLAVMPTKAQMDALGDFISKERGEVILDIDDAQGNTISSTEFSRGTHANKVLQAIRDYFENGTLPQADNTPSVSQFRYSSQDGRYRDLMGEKAAQYVRRLESRLVNELAENLSVPGQAKREVLQPMAEEALRSFFTDGQLDRAKLNDLFETAYQAGIEEDTQYIEQYGDLKKFIRDQKLSISEKDRQDIADYNLFRKAAMGTLTISKDGLPVDVAYQQLQEMAPELFPADITAPSDQLMKIYDVARGIQKVQKTLDEYYGPRAASFKKWQQANFTESIDRLTSGLRVAQRYLEAQNKAKEKLAIPQTAEETKQMWSQLKDARRVVEKAQSKTLLTEADQKIVNRLLRGETSPDYVAGLENGQQILKVYEAKADYDMLALKLKAWNAQRKQGLRDFAEQALTEAEAVKWVDKNMGIRYQRETMERNIRDIARKGKVSDEKANAFINKYFWPVHENESKRKNYLVEQQDRIRELRLDRQVRKGNLVSESYAVQWLGEAEFNRDYLKQHPRVERRGGMTFDEWNAAIQEFEKQNPNLDLGKVRAAVKVFHEVYDKLFQDMNRVRIENGYEPVNYLQGYFPHFQENEEGGSILQKFARAAGIEGDVSPLPATINGLTANFKPGIRYMANIQNRLGYATAYDALQGFDRYIEVATDVIFHTADIQRLRALATQIRYRASDEGLKQRIDAIMMNPFLNPDEANEQVANLTKNGRYGLSNFVDELDEYTNLLAGKKSRLDRGMEKLMGRKFYNVMKKFESRVGANMVAANVGSALTNFIPITQAWSQVSTADVLRGMWDTLKNYKTADGLDSASTFINNRSGYGRLSMSTMDKVSAGAGRMMESIDTFTTGSVVRARYYQNLRRGMSEMSAMQEADQFASGVMADRSKGSTPTLYSARNPLVKLFTQFQLEVNNELSWIFKDMAQEERKKGVAALAKAMFKFLIGAWIYNEFYESIVGRRAAMDPLDIINDTVGDVTGYQIPNTADAMFSGKLDFTTQKEDTYGVAANLTQNLLGELPFTQVLTMLGLEVDNGRIAVASAIPDLGAVLKAATSKDIAPEKRGYTIRRELAKPAYYLVPPFGGGQARKLIQGGVAAWKGGSYSVDNEGRDILQYPVYNDNAEDRAKSWAQALLFGKTATEEAQSWVESGFKSLSAKETAAYQGMTEGGEDQRETYAFIQAARKLEKNYDKMMLLKAYDISDEAKAEYYYQVLAGDTQKAEMEPKSTQERIDYMNEKIQDAQDAKQKQDLKDSVAAGTVTQEKAIQKILANDYAEDENKAYWLYKEWTGGKDYTKYGKILQTIEDGGDLKAAAKEYFDHGTEKGDIGDAITTEYKPKYIAASPEERKKLKEKLLAAYTAVGFDRSKKSKDIDKWLKE